MGSDGFVSAFEEDGVAPDTVVPCDAFADTKIVWLLRRGAVGTVFGGGEADQLPARGALGLRAQRAAREGQVETVTGFRPDLSWLSELRLELDATLQAPRDLAPLIDPNVHSCGTVYPHSVKELSHPEPNVYPVGVQPITLSIGVPD